MSNKLVRQSLGDGIGKLGTITPVKHRDLCIDELQMRGITLGRWSTSVPGWVNCFVPPTAEKWLRDSHEYLWIPNA